MRELLTKILDYTTPFKTLKITGSEQDTVVEGSADDLNLFFKGTISESLPDMKGVFALPDTKFLRGLLNHYKADASLQVKRRSFDGQETVEQLEFVEPNGHGRSSYRCARRMPEMATLPDSVPWTVTLSPDKGKLGEFERLSRLYSDVESGNLFGTTLKDGHLIFSIGTESAQTHSGSMVFASEVVGTLPPGTFWSASQFITVMKLVSNDEVKIRILPHKVLNIHAETPVGTLDYYLRAITR